MKTSAPASGEILTPEELMAGSDCPLSPEVPATLPALGEATVPGAPGLKLPSSNVFSFWGTLSSVMTKSSGRKPVM